MFSRAALKIFSIYHTGFIKLETGRLGQTVLEKLTRKFFQNGRNPKGEKTDLFASVFIHVIALLISETVPRLTLYLYKGSPSFFLIKAKVLLFCSSNKLLFTE